VADDTARTDATAGAAGVPAGEPVLSLDQEVSQVSKEKHHGPKAVMKWIYLQIRPEYTRITHRYQVSLSDDVPALQETQDAMISTIAS
jgi:hypothetical protein